MLLSMLAVIVRTRIMQQLDNGGVCTFLIDSSAELSQNWI